MEQREKGNPRFLVQVDKVLKDKNPSLHAKLPHFVIRWMEKIVYQDQLNNFLMQYGHLDGKAFSDGMMEHTNLQLKLVGIENIPKSGRFTFAANHPLGGIDGLILCSVLGEKYPHFKILVNDILMNVTNMQDYFLPINKHGGQAKEAAKLINDVYASDQQICVFPAGLVSRKTNGVIKDLEWKKNFISKTIQHKRDIIPLHISGQNSKRFYRIANIRKFLGIKINLEMLTLPYEMFKYYNREMTITFGKPIAFTSLDRSKSPLEWAQYVKDIVYQLPNN